MMRPALLVLLSAQQGLGFGVLSPRALGPWGRATQQPVVGVPAKRGLASSTQQGWGKWRRNRLGGMTMKYNTDREAKILCCASLLEYDKSVAFTVVKGDRVLEIGCQGKSTTKSLHQAVGPSGILVGLDLLSRKMPKMSTTPPSADKLRKEMYRDANPSSEDTSVDKMLLVQDIIGTQELMELNESFTVIYIDLTIVLGNDLLLDTLSLLSQLERMYRPSLRSIVVKSRVVSELASSLVTAHAVKAQAMSWSLAQKCAGPAWVCAVGVTEYRSVIEDVVREGDCVLEVGCHMGTSTQNLAEAVGPSGKAFGVDIGDSIIDQARIRYPHIEFSVGDAYDAYSLARIPGAEGGFDVVFVDVGGLSGTSGLLEAISLLRQISLSMGPKLRAIVIKSACMRTHARRSVVGNRLMRGLGDLDAGQRQDMMKL